MDIVSIRFFRSFDQIKIIQVMDTDTNRLTKTPVTMKAVYEEFRDSIAKKHGFDAFRSKVVTKNFAFSVPEVKVPMTCEYLEVGSSK